MTTHAQARDYARTAFVVVRMGEDVCQIVPGLTKVATEIGCAPCKKVIAAVCP